MKAKRKHLVPLNDAALVLLASMPKDSDTDVVFAGTKGQSLSDMSLTAVIRRMNGDDKPVWADASGDGVSVHGFRSSFRMWAAEMTNYPREGAERVLAHQLSDVVERASQFAERASLMADWTVCIARRCRLMWWASRFVARRNQQKVGDGRTAYYVASNQQPLICGDTLGLLSRAPRF